MEVAVGDSFFLTCPYSEKGSSEGFRRNVSFFLSQSWVKKGTIFETTMFTINFVPIVIRKLSGIPTLEMEIRIPP